MWSPQGSWPWETQETDEAPSTEGWSPVSRALLAAPQSARRLWQWPQCQPPLRSFPTPSEPASPNSPGLALGLRAGIPSLRVAGWRRPTPPQEAPPSSLRAELAGQASPWPRG